MLAMTDVSGDWLPCTYALRITLHHRTQPDVNDTEEGKKHTISHMCTRIRITIFASILTNCVRDYIAVDMLLR